MSHESLQYQDDLNGVGVYECEVNLKFRMIEEKNVLEDRDQLLGVLLEAFGYGADSYLETTHVHAEAHQLADTDASPELRRQLIRLRNSREFQ